MNFFNFDVDFSDDSLPESLEEKLFNTEDFSLDKITSIDNFIE